MESNKQSLALVISEKEKIEETIKTDVTVAEILKIQADLASKKITAIKNEEQEKDLAFDLCTSKSMIKDLASREKYYLEPLKIQKKIIEGFFSTLAEPFKKFIVAAEERLEKYAVQKIEDSKKAQARADKELKRQVKKLKDVGVKMPIPKIAAPPPKTVVKTGAGSVYQKINYKIEVEDLFETIEAVGLGDLPPEILKIRDPRPVILKAAELVAAGILPREIFELNESAAKSIVTKGRLSVPGLKISQDVKIQTRT